MKGPTMNDPLIVFNRGDFPARNVQMVIDGRRTKVRPFPGEDGWFFVYKGKTPLQTLIVNDDGDTIGARGYGGASGVTELDWFLKLTPDGRHGDGRISSREEFFEYHDWTVTSGAYSSEKARRFSQMYDRLIESGVSDELAMEAVNKIRGE